MISGESGAGKTETAKHLISHVLHICQSTQSGLGDQIVKVSLAKSQFSVSVGRESWVSQASLCCSV